ncbi:MAG: nuclear transport factor 2 family protein [Xanthomonadales bacterium]|nr:nuclear transport factor 2 family protein [Xanthomonadales bacterium]
MTVAGNQATLERLHAAFAVRDGKTMAACYHPDARFRDPVFDLRGDEIGAMWQMLCSRSADLRIESSGLKVEGDSGRADWQAWYPFSTTGRKVHNIIHSEFQFSAGLIIEQIDAFPFWRWSRQALGPAGLLLGWTPLLRNKVRATAREALRRYMAAANTGH